MPDSVYQINVTLKLTIPKDGEGETILVPLAQQQGVQYGTMEVKLTAEGSDAVETAPSASSSTSSTLGSTSGQSPRETDTGSSNADSVAQEPELAGDFVELAGGLTTSGSSSPSTLRPSSSNSPRTNNAEPEPDFVYELPEERDGYPAESSYGNAASAKGKELATPDGITSSPPVVDFKNFDPACFQSAMEEADRDYAQFVRSGINNFDTDGVQRKEPNEVDHAQELQPGLENAGIVDTDNLFPQDELWAATYWGDGPVTQLSPTPEATELCAQPSRTPIIENTAQTPIGELSSFDLAYLLLNTGRLCTCDVPFSPNTNLRQCPICSFNMDLELGVNQTPPPMTPSPGGVLGSFYHVPLEGLEISAPAPSPMVQVNSISEDIERTSLRSYTSLFGEYGDSLKEATPVGDSARDRCKTSPERDYETDTSATVQQDTEMESDNYTESDSKTLQSDYKESTADPSDVDMSESDTEEIDDDSRTGLYAGGNESEYETATNTEAEQSGQDELQETESIDYDADNSDSEMDEGIFQYFYYPPGIGENGSSSTAEPELPTLLPQSPPNANLDVFPPTPRRASSLSPAPETIYRRGETPPYADDPAFWSVGIDHDIPTYPENWEVESNQAEGTLVYKGQTYRRVD